MAELSDIKFYQLTTSNKKRGQGRKWKVTKSTNFEQKVSDIKKRADCINAKLKTA